METQNKASYSEDDEEDLEALRLAALQTIKRKNEALMMEKRQGQFMGHMRFDRPVSNRGRFFPGRNPNHVKNGFQGQFNNQQFNNTRVRNTNLISIPTISNEEDKTLPEKQPSDGKFTLPQDRWTAKSEQSEKPTENATSKFDRYEHSDKSDSESEEEYEESEEEDTSPGKLKKADSLEALMQELDDEIQGKKKPKDEEKPVVKKRLRKKKKPEIAPSDTPTETETEPETEPVQKPETEPEPIKAETVAKENLKPEEPPKRDSFSPSRNRRRSRSRSPRNFNNQNNLMKRRKRNFGPNFPQQPFNKYQKPVQPFGSYPPPLMQQQFQGPPPFQPFIPPLCPTYPPPFPPPYERPLSPLSINTEQLAAVTMAPLSPRSARFVLQNREIIEKRKRRSYSRSPSPRRRSRSPRRSMSPPPRRKSLSPRSRRSLTPRRNTPPLRKPNKEELSPRGRAPVRDRLGLKHQKPEEKPDSPVKKDEDKALDPVLEARKRKFENKEVKVTEGIIRLKPTKEEQSDEKPVGGEPVQKTEDVELDLDDINEDALLEDDELDLGAKVEDIFSDEESSSDNEGRFKEKENSNGKVAVLPFTKLVNGSKSDVSDKLLTPRRSRRSKARSRSPIVRKSKPEPSKEDTNKSKRVLKSQDKKHISPQLEKRFERKIEIKIKNPAKYERLGKDGNSEPSKTKRKVEVDKKVVVEKDDDEPKIVFDDSDGEHTESTTKKEGDLRAQLSKKRAERLHKGAPVEGNTSRLLQNALQGAVFTKSKTKKDKEVNDGKLPIHLRLGVAETTTTSSSSSKRGGKKSKKVRRSQEQV